MKPLLFLFLLFCMQQAMAQNIGYFSVQKPNGRVVKNFYKGSRLALQTTDGRFWEGIIQAVQNDSLFLRIYDVRLYPTAWGGFVRDTISIWVLGLGKADIARVQLTRRQSFLARRSGPLLMLAGGSYVALNLLNGHFFDDRVSASKRATQFGAGALTFGLGYLLQRLLVSDGFSKRRHRLVFVDL